MICENWWNTKIIFKQSINSLSLCIQKASKRNKDEKKNTDETKIKFPLKAQVENKDFWLSFKKIFCFAFPVSSCLSFVKLKLRWLSSSLSPNFSNGQTELWFTATLQTKIQKVSNAVLKFSKVHKFQTIHKRKVFLSVVVSTFAQQLLESVKQTHLERFFYYWVKSLLSQKHECILKISFCFVTTFK